MRTASLLLAATLAAAIATPSSAQSVRFEGFMTITGATGTCTDYNPTGDEALVRYRPGGVGSNPANSGLSFFYPVGAYNYVPTGKFTGTFKAVQETEIFEYASNQPDSRVRFDTQQPATVTTTTNFINVTGAIENYDWMTGCVAQFAMSVTRRP